MIASTKASKLAVDARQRLDARAELSQLAEPLAAPRKTTAAAAAGKKKTKGILEGKNSLLVIKQVFDEYDKNGDGHITMSELHRSLLKRDKDLAAQ